MISLLVSLLTSSTLVARCALRCIFAAVVATRAMVWQHYEALLPHVFSADFVAQEYAAGTMMRCVSSEDIARLVTREQAHSLSRQRKPRGAAAHMQIAQLSVQQ